MNTSAYMKYRGKCKEMSEQAVKEDPTLRLVREYVEMHLESEEERLAAVEEWKEKEHVKNCEICL